MSLSLPLPLSVHAASRACVSAAQHLSPLLRRLSLAPRFASVATKPRFPPLVAAVSERCGFSSSAFELPALDPTTPDDDSNNMPVAAPPVSRAAGPQPLLTNSVCAVMPPPSPSKRMRSDSFDHIDSRAVPAPAAAAAKPAAAAATDPEAALSKALKSVVKIFCTSANPNYALPWQMMAQSKSTATGFVVAPLSDRRILTNAHAVTNQVQVMLRKHGNARKFPARVLAVGHECDIAMLTVDNDEFWTGDMEALEVGQLPSMQEAVMVVGFPTGGDNVCVTKGVVSRLDRQVYSHGRCALLTTQTDSAINSGNSGGPVLQGAGKLAGIAFQSLIGAENTGYVIPVPVVNHFLTDLERHGGRYTGFPEIGISWQTLESTSMKDSLKLPRGATGVYITSTDPCYNAAKELRVGDVLTHVQGHSIADDGTFLFEGQNVRIDFRHLPSMAYDGDSLQLRVWRDGAAHELSVQVSVPKHLVLPHCHDLKPRYFIYAGLVFTRLTNFYLRHQYGADWSTKAPIKLCDRYYGGVMEAPGQEVVLLSKVLSADVNQGFQDLQNYQVYKVNGVKVHNLQHLAQLVERCEAEYIRFELDWKRVVVLHTASGRAATSEILKMNAIACAHNEGLMEEALCLPPDLEATVQPSLADSEVVPEVGAEPIDADGGVAGKDGASGNNDGSDSMTAASGTSSSKAVGPLPGNSSSSSSVGATGLSGSTGVGGGGAVMDTLSALPMSDAQQAAKGWARL